MRPISASIALFACTAAFDAVAQQAQTPAPAQVPGELEAVVVESSADASAQGLPKPYAGGQVARGARVGVLGTQDLRDTPFSITSYTQELIKDMQAQSVGEVLQNDAGVRQARGFGNFQELYILRGFPLYSDDIAYNGLYGMLPRQYVASEFFERVDVIRGANAFLNGAAPGSTGLGGSINLVPKRAGNDSLSSVSAGIQSGGQFFVSTDLARRFGPDQSTGIRLNAVRRDGDTGIDGESRELTALGLGLDWRSSNVRLSADLGFQDNQYEGGRPSVTPAGFIPAVPGNKVNYAQPWTYSKERDLFGTVRGEWDINDGLTAWAAGGLRRSKESNSLAGVTMVNTAGDATSSRFDNEREDDIATGELGLRGRFATGAVNHEVVVSGSVYSAEERNAWGMGGTSMDTNIYSPFPSARPALTASGGNLSDPARVGETDTRSVAIADTLSFAQDTVRLTLGARRQTIEQSSYDYDTGARSSHYKDSAITPVAGIVFKATDAVSLYANYIEGLQAGEVAPAESGGSPVSNAGEVFAPYRSKQKEVGVKWEGRTLGATLAAFTTDRPVSYVQNGVFGAFGEQRNRGIELNTFGEIRPGLRVLGGVTFLQATLKRTEGGVDQGNRGIGVPARQFNLGLEWDVPGAPGLALNARVVHTGKQYADTANTLTVPSWTRADIGARYVTEVGRNRLLTIRARIDNLFDRQYWASVGGYPGANYLVQSYPRTFMLSASLEF
ncbi:TonB-dependent receptor [Pigmentiphaga soli]|uniref:TonB-dependent receptor n=1 Tax=Pigmentiphaga soli TaxID=1007095 RepID=A0ABP8HIW2_9BURK